MLRSEIKRLAGGSLIYGIGAMLQRFLGLLLLPFYTRALSPRDYGVMALIALVSAACTGLFNLGTGNSLGMLYYRQEDKARRPSIVWSCAALLLLNGLVLAGMLAALAPSISRLMFETSGHAHLIRISLLSLLLVTISDPFYAWLRMEEKAKAYAALTVAGSLLTILLCSILVLGFRRGVEGLLIGTLLSQAAMLVVLLAIVGRRLPLSLDRRLFAPLVRIGFPSIFGLFAFLVLDFANRQMIQRHLGLDALGVFSVGASFAMVMSVFVGAFGSAWPPFFMSFVNRRDDARVVFARVLKYYVAGFGLLTVIFFAAAKPVTALLAAPSFGGAAAVVGMLAAAYMLKGCYLILLPGIYFAEKLQWQSGIEWAAALVNIGLNLWWIPLWGITGAAAATLAGYAILPLLSFVVAKRHLVVDYDWPRIALAAAGVLAMGTLLYKVSERGSVGLVLGLAAPALAALGIWFAFAVLGTSERRLALDKARLLLGRGP